MAESLVKATLQLPCSVVIISARAGDKKGAMTAGAMYVSQVPPLIAVSVDNTFATSQLIEQSQEFAINVITDSQLELAKRVGSAHGKDVDKFHEFNITTESASKIGAPLISGCFAHIECRVRSSLLESEGNHTIYIGEVVGFKMKDDLGPLVWLNNRYFTVGAECRI